MSATTVISTVDNITLVTLQDCPANAASIAKVFDEISQCGINIDMISMAPVSYTHLALFAGRVLI